MTFEEFEAITRLRYQYAQSLDTRDFVLHRSLYTDQITTYFTSYSGGEGHTTISADAGYRDSSRFSTACQPRNMS
ncbi:MAG: hypothetical protein P8L31_12925 [Pseudomonadales bacterium]|jgi:hypothetical protein|nr:hypothetical protein [Pseudomonadales bacterium]